MTLKSTAFRLVAAAGAIITAACDRSGTPVGPALAPEAPLVRQAIQVPDLETLAQTVPGFGGFYLDAKGVPTVYLTDVRQRAPVEAALGAYAGARGFAPSEIRVLQGDYTYKQLDGWFNRLSPEALALSGAVFVDLDEASNRVLVGVEKPTAAGPVRSVASRLGLPGKAVVVKEVEPIHFMQTLRDKVRPVVGGVQIHFSQYLCSLGFNAVDAGQNSFITASHCTQTQGGVENTLYYQPLSSVTGSFIGTEVEDPTYFRGGVCPRGRKCRYSDAARAAYASGANVDLGGIAQTSGANNGSLTITGTFDITAEDLRDRFTIGETVNKVGRTTGWTQGKVTNTCVNTGVSGTNIVQLCQTFVEANQQIVGGGDSGSNVFGQTGANSVTLYGILWGGNSSGTLFVFSPLKNIEREIGSLTTF